MFPSIAKRLKPSLQSIALALVLTGCSGASAPDVSNSQPQAFDAKPQALDSQTQTLSSLQTSLTVTTGPTPIPRGDAIGAADITVRNAYFALSFAVDTASPWGVARGGILDIGVVREDKLSNDFVSLVDFMPNYWSAWPTTYQNVSVVSQSPERVVLLTQRDWGSVELETRFEISATSKRVRIHTKMINSGNELLTDLTSGIIAWPNGGQLFGMPGLTEGDSTPISQSPALGEWSASYDRGWALGLFTPFSEMVAYTGRDRYLKHDLPAGETHEFEAWLQIEDSANLSAFVETEIERGELAHGKIAGRVTNNSGELVADSAVVILKNEKLYAWTLVRNGSYELSIPKGDYQLYATAANHAAGRTVAVSVLADSSTELNLQDIAPPGRVAFSVMNADSAEPLDASLTITCGSTPVIRYFGGSKFFTEVDQSGYVEMAMAPGRYEIDIASAAGFTSKTVSAEVSVESGKTSTVTTEVKVLANPAKHRWFSADLHHHSDVLDGFTAPEYVFRSQLAAGVDLTFLSDHDSTANNVEMARLAKSRETNFIAGTELSASWAHFNAYPIDVDKSVNPDIGQLSVQDIFSEARRLGAEVIHVNHPFGNYGYFDSLEQPGAVPGGYDSGFDLIEITSRHVARTLDYAWQLWNKGKPAYFAAGSDVHDVWRTPSEYSSGAARSFVYVQGELTVDSYVAGLKAGNSYSSQGPLLMPELMFGSEQTLQAKQTLPMRLSVQAVRGLKEVKLIERGKVVRSMQFSGEQEAVDIEFMMEPDSDTWYSWVVSDQSDKYAYSNPVWVTPSG